MWYNKDEQINLIKEEENNIKVQIQYLFSLATKTTLNFINCDKNEKKKLQKKKKQDMQYNYNIHFRCPENDLKFYKLCFEIYQMAVNQMCITL